MAYHQQTIRNMQKAIDGYYKLSWRERIGFCSGDLAQNLIYQTVSIWRCFSIIMSMDSTRRWWP